MKLTKQDITSAYTKIKKRAEKEFNRGDILFSLKDISLAAHVAYLFNFIFRDDELEQLISHISEKVINKQDIEVKGNESSSKYVFIDSFGLPNKGLTQQYLRAMISMNVPFLYILNGNGNENNEIFKEVRSFPKGEIFHVDGKNELENIEKIYSKIENYQPNAVFFHISPGDVVATTVLYAIPDAIKKFNINLTDHAFWLGAGNFDYNLEFRDYGATISYQKRSFQKSQIIINPFYPIIPNSLFKGFPKESENKIILFSGGNYNKIYGENGKFMFMMKEVLEQNPNAVILFAGMGINKRPLEKFINKFHLNKRLLLLGERKDIDKVFENCDIYLNTYPISGGLMSQYAAYYGKPIVSFLPEDNSNKIEKFIFINSNQEVKLTFQELEEYYSQIHKLVNDIQYRKEIGNKIKEALTTKESFDRSVREILTKPISSNFHTEKIEYEKIFEQNLELHNYMSIDLGLNLYKRYKLKSFFIFPKIAIKYLSEIVIYLQKKYF